MDRRQTDWLWTGKRKQLLHFWEGPGEDEAGRRASPLLEPEMGRLEAGSARREGHWLQEVKATPGP